MCNQARRKVVLVLFVGRSVRPVVNQQAMYGTSSLPSRPRGFVGFSFSFSLSFGGPLTFPKGKVGGGLREGW